MKMIQNFSWQRLVVFTVLVSFIYVFMEWLFFVTKPSFMSGMSSILKAIVFFNTSGMVAIIGMVVVAVFFLIGIFLSRLKIVTDVPFYIALSFPPAVLSVLSLILLDNFTYTVFKFGVVSLPYLLRGVYALGVILFFLYLIKWSRHFIFDVNEKIHKRLLVLNGILFFISILFISGQFALPPQQEAGIPDTNRRPNVLIIGSDGLNAENMSLYGYERQTTPNLERFAPEFLVAENAFTNGSTTKVSTITILSGKLSTQTHFISSSSILMGEDAYQHLPGILRSLGYYNIQLGIPIHVDSYAANLQYGFDIVNGNSYNQFPVFQAIRKIGLDEAAYFLSTMFERASIRIFHILYLQDMENPMDAVTKPDENAGITDHEKISKIIDLVENTQSPVFVHAHLMGTHGAIFNPVHRTFSLDEDQDQMWMRDFYDDAIFDFDDYIKELVSGLSKAGELDNTILVIYTDHGMLYRTDLRIPLMIRFPKGEFAGRVVNNVQNIDIAPTILDYLEIDKPNWMGGQSFLKINPPQDRLIISGDGVNIMRIVQCDRLFKFFIKDGIWLTGKVPNHTKPCGYPNIISKADIPSDIANLLNKLEMKIRDDSDSNDVYISYSVTRRQIAAILLQKKYGPDYVAPFGRGIFADVLLTDPDIGRMEQIYLNGIIDSCSSYPLSFCPDQVVSRGEFAEIILKTIAGGNYDPPPAKSVFSDVPVSSPFAPWIEELYARGISDKCLEIPLSYCPSDKLFGETFGLLLNRAFP